MWQQNNESSTEATPLWKLERPRNPVSKSSTTAKNRFVVLSAEKGTEGIVDASEIPALFVHHSATLSTHDTSGQLKYVRMFKQRLLDAKKQ